MQFSNDELKVFETLQKDLSKSIYLIHFDFAKQFYADLNFSDLEINVMIYYITKFKTSAVISFNFEYFFKKSIQSIMFLNRLLTSAKMKY